MKKIISFLFVQIICIASICGQIENPFLKGRVLTGGTLSYKFERSKDFKPGISPLPDVIYTTNKNDFETDFYLGYFLINKLVLGFKTELILSKFKTKSNQEAIIIWDVKENILLFGPFVRYYVYKGLLIEGFTGSGFINNNTNGDLTKSGTLKWNFGIGYDVLINDHIAIEPLLRYGSFRKNTSEINEKEVSKGITISIGLQIFLSVPEKAKH